MIPTLDPLILFMDAWKKSRLLRVAALVAALTLLLLLAETVLGRVAPSIALVLVLFNLGVWYFALSMKSAFAHYRKWSKNPWADRLEAGAELLALVAIGSCQILFLISVLRLWSPPPG